MAEIPVLVQALYAFKGKNNDELNFRKGDVITITQMDDGGWWEGTLNEKTGWFPSNYVKEIKPTEAKELSELPAKVGPDVAIQQKTYRDLILTDMIDSEKAHVDDLKQLWETYLHPLEQDKLLTKAEFAVFVGNVQDILEAHQRLLNSLEESRGKNDKDQRIGKLFLSMAAHLKSLHNTYCSNHPKAVSVLEKHRNELMAFMEAKGATNPALMVLTTGLSKPFRRLDKYAGMLQELERHMEESHPDRGDTQRSVHIYKDLSSTCAAIRRQKELELEIMSGTVRNWEGEEPAKLGEILHVGSVAVGVDHRDRYFVLFQQYLVMLSVSPRLSAFIYEGKLPLSGVQVTPLEDKESLRNAFEVTGPMIDRIVAVCQTKDDQLRWCELLQAQIRRAGATLKLPHVQSPPVEVKNSPKSVVLRHPLSPATVSNPSSQPNQPFSPTCVPPSTNSVFAPPSYKVWSQYCLRPAPPLKPCLAIDREVKRKLRKKESSYDDDMAILQVIEAYCLSAKSRNTINSTMLDSPQVLIAEEEKIIVEDGSGNTSQVEEKTLVDTVYALKDQLKTLQEQMSVICKEVELLQKKHSQLERNVKNHVLPEREDIFWDV